MKTIFSSSFLRQFKSLPSDLKEETVQKIKAFENPKNHKNLKVHKLHGKLKGRYSFSVSYKIRVVFSYLSKNEAVFHTVGDHQIYQ